MSDATSDRTEGKVEELKGRGQKAWGEITNDEEKEVEGETSKVKGKVKQTQADAKEKIDETVKDLTDK